MSTPSDVKIRELKSGTVYLFHEQSHAGRVFFETKREVRELQELELAELRTFSEELMTVCGVLKRVLSAKTIEMGLFGSVDSRVRFHLVPRYEAETFEVGQPFAFDPARVYLGDSEREGLVAKISAELLRASGFDMRTALNKLRREITADGRIDLGETALLLELLAPMAENDRRVAALMEDLHAVREDGVVTTEESAQLLSRLGALLA